MGDHLDVLGHFEDDSGSPILQAKEPAHADWLSSGSGFDRDRFAALTSAIAEGMLGTTRAPGK
jgi:hypothetical protein